MPQFGYELDLSIASAALVPLIKEWLDAAVRDMVLQVGLKPTVQGYVGKPPSWAPVLNADASLCRLAAWRARGVLTGHACASPHRTSLLSTYPSACSPTCCPSTFSSRWTPRSGMWSGRRGCWPCEWFEPRM